jgi:hypothetical protein
MFPHRLIVISPCSHLKSCRVVHRANMLHIVGFDSRISHVIEDFLSGKIWTDVEIASSCPVYSDVLREVIDSWWHRLGKCQRLVISAGNVSSFGDIWLEKYQLLVIYEREKNYQKLVIYWQRSIGIEYQFIYSEPAGIVMWDKIQDVILL